MDITSTTATDPAVPDFSKANSGSQLGKEEFLKLLVAQLSNQDPLNPLEGQEFASQLAQFSSVEALLNIESALGQNMELSALIAQSTNSGVAASLIGKTVTAGDNYVDWSGEGESTLHYDLDGSAEKVTIEIKNEAGVVIRTIETKGQDTGENFAAWDGKTDAGDVADKGAYTFEAKAIGFDGAEIPVTTHTTGLVDRVSFTAEGIILWIGSVSIKMADVRSVAQ